MSEPMSHDCRAILMRISAYLDSDLEATACDAIERHCQNCVRCAALVAELRETIGLCRQAAAMPFPDSVRRRARESVRRLLDEDSAER
jgi:anti-sigma factor RsiW